MKLIIERSFKSYKNLEESKNNFVWVERLLLEFGGEMSVVWVVYGVVNGKKKVWELLRRWIE